MNKSIGFCIGLVSGIVAVMLVSVFARKLAKKHSKSCKEFDERQTIARGKSWRTGFIAFILMNLILTLLELADVHFAEPAFLFLIETLIAVMAFVIDAVFRDAYFKVGESKNVWWFVPFGLVYVALGFINCKDKFLTDNGLLSTYSIIFCSGFMFLIVFVCICIKKFMDKKSEKEEGENE